MEVAKAAHLVGAGAHGRSVAMAAMTAMAGVVLVCVVVLSSTHTMVGTEDHPIELLRQVTQKLEQEKHCGSSCKAQKALVAKQMKALRAQIQGDYTSMVTFGDKAGYVPPPRSIKSQVMDGTLLGGGDSDDGPKPPPAFKPVIKGSAFGAAKEKKLLASEEPGASSSGSSILPPVQSVKQMANKFMSEEPASAPSSSSGGVDFLHPDASSPVHVHSASRKHISSGESGKEKWEKEFSFTKNHQHHSSAPEPEHVRGPKNAEPAVVRRAMQKALSFSLHRSKTEEEGDKLLGLHPHHHTARAKKGDPLEGSKFLRDYFGEGR
eukprot:CAMPEP_0181315654 /NCGR_PEP_ID=MMETSP1101-20121128/15490_1 /TAXON_ID=46948 /ORGANISM="Rhodomonas abbreviata, Strain Caron Lab Isolate" /LENGTH=320 /DNA_ID=CAMNT_0023422875 /DNA_START=45 /DNA_END=1007 /DNA_ORIENTATION=-